VIRTTAIAAALALTACAAPSEPGVIVRTERVEVPVRVPVPVSPSLTTPPDAPVLPADRLSNEDLAQHIEALAGYACRLRAQLADIAIAHGAGADPVDCEATP
jgi:hypothetical protein